MTTATIPPFTLYNTNLNVSYAPDVFGLVRQIKSPAAQADFQRDELEAAYLGLTSNIVTAAVTEASLRAQIDATNKVIDAERGADHSPHPGRAGRRGAGASAAGAGDAVAAEATLPPLQLQLAQTRNQLAVFVGAFPGDYHEADFTLAGLTLPQDLPVSLPSAIVAQRPDIQAAAAAAYGLGQSRRCRCQPAAAIHADRAARPSGVDDRHVVHAAEPGLEPDGGRYAAAVRRRHADGATPGSAWRRCARPARATRPPCSPPSKTLPMRCRSRAIILTAC